MILTLSFIPAVTIAESGSIQLAIILDRVRQTERRRDSRRERGRVRLRRERQGVQPIWITARGGNNNDCNIAIQEEAVTLLKFLAVNMC